MKRYFLLGLIVLLGISLKIGLLLMDVFPFNADEAIVGLMARHILIGERPIFFYGQAYMGSLDAFLVAGVFKVFGPSVWGIRLVQVILYLFTILTTYWLGKRIFNSHRAGLISALLLAIPPVNVMLYSTVSLGGYGEALLIGNLILLTTCSLYENFEPASTNQHYFNGSKGEDGIGKASGVLAGYSVENKIIKVLLWLLWGFLCGLGLWANGLTLVYSIPAGIWLIYQVFRRIKIQQVVPILILLLAGLIIGSLPWWIFAFQNGFSELFQELLGEAVAVETEPFLLRSINHILYFILLGLPAAIGLRPPWDVVWLGLPLIPFVLLLWGRIIWDWFRISNPSSLRRIIEGIFLTFLAGFVFTSFGVDPSGRYFLPIWFALSLMAGGVVDEWGRKKAIGLALIGVILLFNLWGNLQCALSNPPGLTTQFYPSARVDMRAMPELIQFLREKGAIRGYSNYWVAYPLAFLTNEEIIFSPRFPYHPDLRYTERDDRYPVYTKLVEESDQVALITTLNPALDEKLRRLLNEKNVRWNEKQIGDFVVYYELSEPVRIVDFEKLFIQTRRED